MIVFTSSIVKPGSGILSGVAPSLEAITLRIRFGDRLSPILSGIVLCCCHYYPLVLVEHSVVYMELYAYPIGILILSLDLVHGPITGSMYKEMLGYIMGGMYSCVFRYLH